jgi:hypothetical protein
MEREREYSRPLERPRERVRDERTALVDIGRFGIVGLYEIDTRTTNRLFRNELVKWHSVLIGKRWERVEFLKLTRRGRKEARRLCGPLETVRLARKDISPLHDVEVYRYYRRAVDHIEDSGGHVQRVILESDFQAERSKALWKSKDTIEDSRRYAATHELPFQEGSVQIPDVRIIYEDATGNTQHVDLEVVTPNYSAEAVRGKATGGFKLSGTGNRRSSPLDKDGGMSEILGL